MNKQTNYKLKLSNETAKTTNNLRYMCKFYKEDH